MKIKIESDVFDITKRIKEIDENYYVVFDDEKNIFELHNSDQSNTYCITYPYVNLDKRLIDRIYYTSMGNIDNIIYDIDKNNTDIENTNKNHVRNQSEYMLREIYEFSNNSSKNLCKNSFVTKWR